VVLRFRVELRRVGVGLAGHFHDADDAGFLAVRVIEKHLVPDLHLVANHISRLVVADAVPGFALVALEIVDAVDVGFGLHEPVCHVVILRITVIGKGAQFSTLVKHQIRADK
jgi:hypothetical protein